MLPVGDVHGDLQKVLACLEMAGVLAEDDGHIKWVGGDATVVQLGDVLDRGDCEIGAPRRRVAGAGCWGLCLWQRASLPQPQLLQQGQQLCGTCPTGSLPAAPPAAGRRPTASLPPCPPPPAAGSVLLLRELDRQARQAGGAVYMLNGNHESLNVAGDFR